MRLGHSIDIKVLISERERMSQMQDHYDRLLLKAKTELEAPRQQLKVAQDDLDKMQWRRVTQQ